MYNGAKIIVNCNVKIWISIISKCLIIIDTMCVDKLNWIKKFLYYFVIFLIINEKLIYKNQRSRDLATRDNTALGF